MKPAPGLVFARFAMAMAATDCNYRKALTHVRRRVRWRNTPQVARYLEQKVREEESGAMIAHGWSDDFIGLLKPRKRKKRK